MPGNRDIGVYTVKVKQQGKAAERLDLSHEVLSFGFEENERKLDKLTLTVDNFDLRNFDNPVWAKGNILEFSWGNPGNMAPPREAVIMSVKGFTMLTIEAHDRAALMDLTTKSRVFENMTRSAVVKQVASEHGYTNNIDVEDTQVVHPVVTQARLTDAQFLKKLSLREHFEFYVDATGLHWHARKLGQRPVRTLTYYTDQGAGDILSINLENDITKRPGKVSMKGRDPLNKKDISQSADNKKGATLAPVREVIDPITGQATRAAAVGQEETSTTSEDSEASAKRQANGKYRKVQETTAKLNLTVVGDPLLAAKRIVIINGIGNRLSGPYYVTVATTKIDNSGYTVELKTLRDGHGGYAERINAENKALLNTKTPPSKASGNVVTKQVIDPITGVPGPKTYHEGEAPK